MYRLIGVRYSELQEREANPFVRAQVYYYGQPVFYRIFVKGIQLLILDMLCRGIAWDSSCLLNENIMAERFFEKTPGIAQ